jgi:twitching motility two-component system response regulator PilH
MSKKVLICDDSATDLNSLKTILSDVGCLVIVAKSGADAIAKARSEQPSMIFLDIVMPDMDGYAVVRELANDAATKAIPVCMVSSKSQKADQVWAQMQGAKGYIVKPARPEQVVDQLKSVA